MPAGAGPPGAEPTDATPRIVLVGRPNAGKSSVYNLLTGGDAKVGNFPGVTVELLEGRASLEGQAVDVVDLPGVDALTGEEEQGTDEAVTQRYLRELDPERGRVLVVQVVDGARLALGLRLTRALLELELPLCLVVTQKDVLEQEGRALDTDELARRVGVAVLLIDARKGAEAALEAFLPAELARGRLPEPRALDAREIAREVLRDERTDEVTLDRRKGTERLDGVLLHPLVGPLAFLCIMGALFAAVFLIADPVTAAIDWAAGHLRLAITRVLGEGLAASFLSDGLVGGAGTVLGFLPQVVLLTVGLEVMDASGYLARGSFLVDRLLRVFGLGGKAFVPLLSGHACAVPAIRATRILKDPAERLRAILVIPLATCSARLPTYGLLIAVFFAGASVVFKAGLFVGLYVAGLAAALLASWVLRGAMPRTRSLPLLLEMPPYRTPQLRQLLRTGWRAGKRFAFDVGTTIVAVAAVLWVLLNVPVGPSREGEHPIERSAAAYIGRALEPVTAPLGFDWRINVGLVGSFGARELMVGTLGVVYGLEGAGDDPKGLVDALRDAKKPDGAPRYGRGTGLALLAFFVLACQCMSTLEAIRKETRSVRWPVITVLWTYAAAYGVAFLVAKLAG